MGVARALVVILLYGTATGCAGARAGAACGAQPDLSRGFAVYQPCGVTRTAKLVTGPRRLDYTPTTRQACITAMLEFVVDPRGVPMPETAKVLRTNDMNLANAMLAALPQLKYEPAQKDGMPVAQLAQYATKVAMGSGPSAADARMRARSNRNAC